MGTRSPSPVEKRQRHHHRDHHGKDEDSGSFHREIASRDGDGRRRRRRRSRSPQPVESRHRRSRFRDKDRQGMEEEDSWTALGERKRTSRNDQDCLSRRWDEQDSKQRIDNGKGNDSDSIYRGRRDTKPAQLRRPLASQADSFALVKGEDPAKPKERPNFGTTGALATASNSVAQADGSIIVLKYHEPPEARKPPAQTQWRIFVFKGEDILDTVQLNTRSCWLIGREVAVVDLTAEHPSISKQHAAIQFRHLERTNEYGDRVGKVKPYLIDLGSANGTKLNSKTIPKSRYLELKHKDLIQFGDSTREYVIMFTAQE